MKRVCVCVCMNRLRQIDGYTYFAGKCNAIMAKAGSIAQRYYYALVLCALLNHSYIATNTQCVVYCVCHAMMNCAKCLLYESTQNQLMLKVLR